MKIYDVFVSENLHDPKFKVECEALDSEFAIIQAVIEARKNSGLTQKQLSERSGIAQGDISRIERGVANPSLKTLKSLASGMNMKLKIEFLPANAE